MRNRFEQTQRQRCCLFLRDSKSSCESGKRANQTGENESQTWTENTQKCIETKEKWVVRKVEFTFEIRYTVCVITAENHDASDLRTLQRTGGHLRSNEVAGNTMFRRMRSDYRL